jgi:hypothetical protein
LVERKSGLLSNWRWARGWGKEVMEHFLRDTWWGEEVQKEVLVIMWIGKGFSESMWVGKEVILWPRVWKRGDGWRSLTSGERNVERWRRSKTSKVIEKIRMESVCSDSR